VHSPQFPVHSSRFSKKRKLQWDNCEPGTRNFALGAHLSIAGGLERALLKGAELGCRTVQLFTKSPSRWGERVLKASEIDNFREVRKDTGISPLIAHGGYLANLSSPDKAVRRKSVNAVCREMERCGLLGIDYLVVHPGSYLDSDESRGLERAADSIGRVLGAAGGSGPLLLVETTAGQGTCIGRDPGQIARLLSLIGERKEVGICIDSCHIFAAGHDIRSAAGYRDFFGQVEGRIGFDRLKVFHLNDSLRECGSRIDRHAHIGKGRIGEEFFRRIMNDSRFRCIPKIIETPKEGEMDRINLGLLRGMAQRQKLRR